MDINDDKIEISNETEMLCTATQQVLIGSVSIKGTAPMESTMESAPMESGGGSP